MNEGRIEENRRERDFYELALKCSGAVQARRWTRTHDGGGFIYSFNGPHSLFADTIRTLRVLAAAHQLGHVLMEEGDQRISLLERLIRHGETTARYNVYYGQDRDIYDVNGRVAHEAIFNVNNGHYRCCNSQQGFSAYSTWTRALAWIMLGFAEQLEYISWLDERELSDYGQKERIESVFLKACRASCDYYIENTPVDGVPYWDTAASGLGQLGDYLDNKSDPYNKHEPVDSSAAAIASQGLLRLGRYMKNKPGQDDGRKYFQAGLTVLQTILAEPYLSTDDKHQGLILHSVYHRPNGWDYIPEGAQVPCGESSMWGDYHARESALLVGRMATDQPYYTFFRQETNH